MGLKEGMLNEIGHEAASTRKMLERVPFDKITWKPHEKSMTLGRLASHVAELNSWINMTVETEGLDLATANFTPFVAQSVEELLEAHDKHTKKAIEALTSLPDEAMMHPWVLRRGEHIMFTMPKVATIRHMAMNHIYHHRGQLSVFLRMLDVPVPGMYGPSKDDQIAMAAKATEPKAELAGV